MPISSSPSSSRPPLGSSSATSQLPTSSYPTSPSSSSHHHRQHHHQQQHYHEEDRLGRAWTSLASAIVMATQKADKAANMKPQPTKEALKDLDDTVVGFLKARIEWGRQITHVEAKLQGKAQEMETMDCYMRSQPRLGRKRKRENNMGDSQGKGEQEGQVGIVEAVNAVASQQPGVEAKSAAARGINPTAASQIDSI